MKRFFVFSSAAMLLCFRPALFCAGQTAGTAVQLDSCISLGCRNYPQISEYDLIDAAQKYDIANAALSWVPQLSVSGKASWQSDVVEMPFDMKESKFDIPHDQYGITADISQQIWDGGSSASRREFAVKGAEVKRRQLEVNMYSIRSKVQSIYLGIILLDKQLELNELLSSSLERSLEETAALLDGGLACTSDLDQIRVKLLDCRQQKTSLETDRRSYVRMLSLLTGTELADASFVEPEPRLPDAGDSDITRPELLLYDAQLAQVEAQRRQLNTAFQPRLNLNLQAGYGRPGLNMLSGQFDPYFVAGLKLQWNFGALYTLGNDRRKADTDAARIELSRRSFLLNTSVEAEQKRSELAKAADVLAQDDSIIELRQSILESARTRYREGVIKMNDYLGFLDDEFKARVNRSLHSVQYIKALLDLEDTLGR